MTRVHRTLWKRDIVRLTLRLERTGQKLRADPVALEPPLADGAARSLPSRGETVSLVLNEAPAVERRDGAGHGGEPDA